jgi:Cdc6-like AAA superfamily ATPase
MTKREETINKIYSFLNTIYSSKTPTQVSILLATLQTSQGLVSVCRDLQLIQPAAPGKYEYVGTTAPTRELADKVRAEIAKRVQASIERNKKKDSAPVTTTDYAKAETEVLAKTFQREEDAEKAAIATLERSTKYKYTVTRIMRLAEPEVVLS